MSVWHTPQAWRRTRTSPARGPSSSTSCTASGCPNSSNTAARIRMAASAPVGGARHLRVVGRPGLDVPVLLDLRLGEERQHAQVLRTGVVQVVRDALG